MMQAIQPKTLLEYALAYADCGIKVVPLHTINDDGKCTCGNIECRTPGKHPLTPNGLDDGTTDINQITSWFGSFYAWANIGLLTENICLVDVDPRHGGEVQLEMLEKEHGKLPDTITARTGGGGSHYVFAKPFGVKLKGKLAKGIDIKSDGGYIVAEPSLHESGRRYEWIDGQSPFENYPIALMPEWMITILTEPAEVVPFKTGAGFIDADRVKDLRSALGFIDADEHYLIWIKVGQALHSTEAENAFGLWNEWSQAGSKAEKSYSAKECRKKWAGFTANRDKGVYVETIFALAEERGWVNPARGRQALMNELAEMTAKAERKVTYDLQDEAALPVMRPPVPILGSLFDWFTQSEYCTYPQASLVATLSIACTVAARRYQSAYGDSSSVYFGITTPTINALRYVKGHCHGALNSMAMRELIRGTRIGSAQALHRSLIKMPVLHYVADDYSQLVAYAKRQPSGVLEQALNLLADVHTGQNLYLDPDSDPTLKDQASMVIYAPNLTMLALIQEDMLASIASKQELGRGALEQMLFVKAGNEYLTQRRGELPFPAEVINTAKIVRAVPPTGNLSDLLMASCELVPAQVKTIAFSPETLGLFDALEAHLHDLANNSRQLRTLARGAVTTARRLLVALSAWANPASPVATRELAVWATNYVKLHASEFFKDYPLIESDDGKADTYQKVNTFIIERGKNGITARELGMNCRAFRSIATDKRDELIKQLELDGFIVSVKRGRADYLTSTRFAKPQVLSVQTSAVNSLTAPQSHAALGVDISAVSAVNNLPLI